MKRKRILAITAVSAAFAVAVGFAIQGHQRAKGYRQALENSYTHAYYEFTAAVSELDAALQKGQYVTTPVLLGTLCTDIYGKAAAAQMALGELPASAAVLEQTTAFLARTGDYAHALARTAAAEGCDEEARATLRELATVSAVLSASLLDLQSDLAGGVTIDMLLQAEEALAQRTGDGEAGQGGTTFQSIEADFPETPTLIYDGPFSEHLGGKTPLALEGLPQVGRDEARALAAEFLGLRPEVFTLTSDGDGALPVWGFSAAVDGGEVYLEVTKQGGKVLSLFSSRPAGDTTLSPLEAVEAAKRFLARQGFENMAESYHIDQGNVLTVNFAPMQDGVLCYPDLVKVAVALDTGTVVGFESHGWLMNHTLRGLTEPSVNEETARAVVAPELEILAHQLALIPTAGEYEVFCHEFKCRTLEGTHVIIYVNADTGQEEKVLLLLEDDSGTLVW